MNKFKKIITIGFTITLLNTAAVTLFHGDIFAADTAKAEQYKTGYIYDPEQEYAPISEDSLEDLRENGAIGAKYPTKIDNITSLYPVVKNQGNYGTCWAFATIGTAELYANKKKNGIKPDYSELALAYNTYASTKDPLGGISNDKNIINAPKEDFLSLGGNAYRAYMTLFKWFGVSDEKVAPYNSSGITKVKTKGMTTSESINDAMHLESMSMIDISANQGSVKQCIKDNGGVYGSIFYDYNAYNSKTNSYYLSKENDNGHGVIIVGWDDNYKADNFKQKPKGNGAWLVRNSWGYNGFGINGYFWVSYYDISFSKLRKTVYSATYDFGDKYDNNYQYDGSISDTHLSGKPTIIGANVFEARSGKIRENLRAVAVGIKSANTKYTIDIYKNPDKNNPTSGVYVPEARTVGEKQFAGIYTIPLRNSVMLEKGDRFAVVITLEGDKGARLSVETSRSDSSLKTVASIKEGESFYRYSVKDKWNDLCQKGYGNLRIKAFTEDVGSKVPVGWYYNSSLKAMQFYDKPGEYVKGWKWMDESTKETVPHHSFFNLKNGALYTGWHEMGAAEGEKVKHTSYFGSNGWLRTGWQWMDEKEGQKTPHWSYFGSNGWLRTGWVQMGKGTSEPDNNNAKHWSYFDSKGWLVTNCTLKINGNYYTFDDRGWLISEPFGLNGGRSDAKIAAGWYTINAFGNKKYCLDVSGASPENSANIILYQVNKTKAQKFYVEPKGNGIYRILTGTNNKKSTMDIAGNGKKSGTNVAQYVANNTEAQLWKILKNPDGSVGIVALSSGLALDIEGNMYKNGSNITIYQMNSTMAQKFSFNKA